MSLKDMFMRKMVQSQMKGIPAEEQERILEIIQKNPALFQNIALEAQAAIKSGKDQMSAVRDVLEKYKDQLSSLK